jgi:hypothetical protein
MPIPEMKIMGEYLAPQNCLIGRAGPAASPSPAAVDA